MKIRINNNKITNNMKRTILSFAIFATMAFSTMSANAQNNGGFDGFFGSGTSDGGNSQTPIVPYHNLESNQNAAPLGSGLVVLGALGAGYALLRRKED